MSILSSQVQTLVIQRRPPLPPSLRLLQTRRYTGFNISVSHSFTGPRQWFVPSFISERSRAELMRCSPICYALTLGEDSAHGKACRASAKLLICTGCVLWRHASCACSGFTAAARVACRCAAAYDRRMPVQRDDVEIANDAHGRHENDWKPACQWSSPPAEHGAEHCLLLQSA